MFLSKLLPTEGMYCVARLTSSGGFRHYFYKDLTVAVDQLNALDRGGYTAYIAQATYDPIKINEALLYNKERRQQLRRQKTESSDTESHVSDRRKERSQDNAAFLKNFFLDIDCGEKWPLKNQREGVDNLKQFIAETGLPFPAVVSSGNGLYTHWILTQSIPAPQWRTIAQLLKRVVAEYAPKLGGDSSRTADSASVLRAPGMTNRKPGHPEKPVRIVKDADPIEFSQFVDLLSKAAAKKKINRDAALAPKPSTDINAEFFTRQEVEYDALLIAAKCNQIKTMRDTGGDISEPLWYSCIGVLAHCIDGERIIHEWSQGHTGYDPSQTDAKIEQWRSAGVGPSTCVNLGSCGPSGCIGCPHNGKIKSPIVLGRPAPEIKELDEAQCPPPDGFRRGKDGLFVEEDGRWIRFYDQDLWIDLLAFDESLGYEVMTIKHSLPYEGNMECTVRCSLVNDPKALLTTLSDNHIAVVGMKEKKYMVAYLESYRAKLQRQRRMSLMLSQMGWKTARNGKAMFVLGRKVFHEDGAVEEAALARNVPKAAEAYHSAGSLEKWSEATRILDKPGMEPFAFALLAGGFGAPLMKFTGFDGALVSLIGESGAGKTLMLRFIQSVWGFHSDLMMLRDDTRNALVSRLGVYGNLPLTIDEVTNIDGIELSDLVYRITQGRDKARLTKNSEEKKTMNSWNTLAVTSSNASLVDKLSGAKHDATAEINRVFEYPVMERDNFKGQITTELYWTLHENYGHAGERYAAWMVQNTAAIKETLDKVRERIDMDASIKGDERFWGAVASAAIYGGLVAQRLGLIKFNVTNVMNWAADTIRGMRTDKQDLAGDAVGVLGQFLDEHAANRLLVKGPVGRGPEGCMIIEPPRGQLVTRFELDTNILYLSRSVFKTWLARRFGSYTTIKNELMEKKVLLDPNKRKILGAGTYFGGAQQACWEINMSSSRLGPQLQQLKEVSVALEADPAMFDGKDPSKGGGML